MESRNVVYTICSFTRSIGCSIEWRKPKCSNTQVIEITRFNHLRDTCKVTALPISPLCSSNHGLIVRGVSIHKTVGHDHVDESILPNEISRRSCPEWNKQVIGRISVNIKTLDFQRMFPIFQSTDIVGPSALLGIPNGAGNCRGRTTEGCST